MRIDVVHATLPPGGLSPRQTALIRRSAPAGAALTIRLPDDAPPSISSRYEDALAMRGVLAQVRAAAADGADAVVINCTADTALEAAREAVPIPVVGVSETALHLAAQLSLRFSVLTFAARIAPRFDAMAKAAGLADRLASVRSVETPLEALDHGDGLAGDLAAAAAAAVEIDGAHLVVLGCTDFETVAADVAAALDVRGIGVPLIRPLQAGLHLAAGLAAMGLTQSRRSYPLPRLIAGP